MALGTIANEGARKAALGMARGRGISEQLRGGLLRNTQSSDGGTEDETAQPSAYKSRLAMLKSGAIKAANRQGGAAAGATVGGAIGSVVPVVGTGIGAFIGRFVGKKLGITGIIIMAILMITFFIVMFIAILKGACDKVYGAQWAVGIHDICAAIGS